MTAMDRQARKAYNRIRLLARTWQIMGSDRKLRREIRISAYLASAVVSRAADIIMEEYAKTRKK